MDRPRTTGINSISAAPSETRKNNRVGYILSGASGSRGGARGTDAAWRHTRPRMPSQEENVLCPSCRVQFCVEYKPDRRVVTATPLSVNCPHCSARTDIVLKSAAFAFIAKPVGAPAMLYGE